MLYPIFIFILAGLCEIGGGYLIWLWLREGQSSLVGLIGGAILMLYGVIATFQSLHHSEEYMQHMVAYLSS